MTDQRRRPFRGAAAFALILALTAPPLTAPSLAAAGEDPAHVALLPVRVLDTSGEPRDQTAVHAARAQAMDRLLATALAARPGGEVTVIAPGEIAARCPKGEGRCLIALVRDTGADQVLVASVHKTSSLILTLYAQLVDIAGDRTILAREMSFRGDTDDAWSHAAGMLAEALTR